jgi:glycerophosphoryl diester phosphodiesterase
LKTLARQLCIAVAALAATAPAAAALDVHAHRGGGLGDGKPVALENSLSAFKSAGGRAADVVELDVHVSKDGVPFVMHDGTLDRTTDCSGPVADHKGAELDDCHIDLLGTNDVFKEAPGSNEPVPRLAAVLRWAKSDGARLNIEINHYPTEPSYDPGPGFVNAELDAIDASGIAKDKVLLQSFLPGNLDPAEQRGYTTALITFSGANAKALSLAKSGGYDVLEPQWPVDGAAGFVKRAHAAGRTVVPYTLDRRSEVRAARAAGVDGLITDDPPLARGAVRCYDADVVLGAAQRRLAAAKAAARRAHGAAAKRRAAARVKAAKRQLAKAKGARSRACAR